MAITTYVTYNGKQLDPDKFKIEHLPDYSIPERDLEKIHVNGRDGDVVIDYGSYKNITRSYNISFGAAGPEDFAARVSDISAWLSGIGYAELSDTYDKDYYWQAIPSGEMNVQSILNGRMGKVTVNFSCVPRKYLMYGKKTVLVAAGVSGLIYNPTLYEAAPLIVVYRDPDAESTSFSDVYFKKTSSTNDYDVKINNSYFTAAKPVVIDCQRETVYLQDANLTNFNNRVQIGTAAGFPKLAARTNTMVSFSGPIKKAVITPNFWVR